jgi:hypothetical protein
MFSSASTGAPAATEPTTGSRRPRRPPGPPSRPCRARRRDAADRAIEQLDGARLGRIAAQQAGLLEVRQVRVDGRGGRQPDRLADVAHGGRIAVARRVLLDELEDLLLALGEVHGGGSLRGFSAGRSNVCS